MRYCMLHFTTQTFLLNMECNGGRINCQIIGWEMFWEIETDDILIECKELVTHGRVRLRIVILSAVWAAGF